jgi:excisionase family DNA binding protein
MITDNVKEPIARLTPTIGLEEAGKLLHCHPDTVRKRAKAGELPGTKVGRSWVFYTDSLLEWLQERIKAGQPRRDDPMHTGGSALAAKLERMRLERIADRSGGQKRRIHS